MYLGYFSLFMDNRTDGFAVNTLTSTLHEVLVGKGNNNAIMKTFLSSTKIGQIDIISTTSLPWNSFGVQAVKVSKNNTLWSTTGFIFETQ